MKKLGLLAVAAVFLIVGVLAFGRTQKQEIVQTTPTPLPSPSAETINIKASFKIVTQGTERIFTDPKYHNQSKDIFIQLPDPSIVNVTAKNVTWNDFFQTLPKPMNVTKDCLTTGTNQLFCTGDNGSLKFYLNGVEDKDLLDKEIKEGNKALIEFGN